MSMLTEKRDELVAKRDALLVDRAAEIDCEVEKYRAELEATKPLPQEAIALNKAIEALNEVIAIEEATKPQEPEPIYTCPAPEVKVEEVPAEAVNIEQVPETITVDCVECKAEQPIEIPTIEVVGQEAEGRPGMTIITGPERG